MTALLRPALPDDATATGEILYAFARDTDWMPLLHCRDETVMFCGVMIARGWVTVAVLHGRVAGFIARDGGEICSLYLARKAQGRGLGARLLQQAQHSAEQLELWTFQANVGARRFYERHGFRETQRTDGSRNDERLPDIRYEWSRT
ncbi:GNAT family N-acetyltransferase [Ruegeria sp. WL0004]|uniref:GNAT family N-acetyltransferase n=1 Tax=Ruegeria marisflavi TaxID=2984152 RepID=A0ABT2WNZ8_9RHOB|nr:GNAT family N-acetyltransferase [Ruegeria sp. WL0004]MCU9837624.1 GNAT family N-acetyltransferase [Ruegeria sp. WL0004]